MDSQGARFSRRYLLPVEEDIPSPTPDLRVGCVLDFRPEAELVAVLVSSLRLFIFQVKAGDAEGRRRVNLGWLGDAVVVYVLPQTQR